MRQEPRDVVSAAPRPHERTEFAVTFRYRPSPFGGERVQDCLRILIPTATITPIPDPEPLLALPERKPEPRGVELAP